MTRQEIRQILATGGLSLLATPKRRNGRRRDETSRPARKRDGDAITPLQQQDNPAQPTRTG